MKYLLLLLFPAFVQAHELHHDQLVCVDTYAPDNECFTLYAGTHYEIVNKNGSIYTIEIQDEPNVGLLVVVPRAEIRSRF